MTGDWRSVPGAIAVRRAMLAGCGSGPWTSARRVLTLYRDCRRGASARRHDRSILPNPDTLLAHLPGRRVHEAVQTGRQRRSPRQTPSLLRPPCPTGSALIAPGQPRLQGGHGCSEHQSHHRRKQSVESDIEKLCKLPASAACLWAMLRALASKSRARRTPS